MLLQDFNTLYLLSRRALSKLLPHPQGGAPKPRNPKAGILSGANRADVLKEPSGFRFAGLLLQTFGFLGFGLRLTSHAVGSFHLWIPRLSQALSTVTL